MRDNDTLTLREKLIKRADTFAHKAYKITKQLPKYEVFGIGSQLRRASISVVCNIIEGFARDHVSKTHKDILRFMEIAHGSLEEAKYLITFSREEFNLNRKKVNDVLESAKYTGKLLYGFIKKLR